MFFYDIEGVLGQILRPKFPRKKIHSIGKKEIKYFCEIAKIVK